MPKAPPPNPGPPPRSARSPLDDTSRLIVDGTNLLYRLGTGGRGAAAPPAAIIGRLRAAIPGQVAIDLVFDGMGHGVFGRVAQGMYVRYSGHRTADEVILDLVPGPVPAARPNPTAAGILVVTNDRELRTLLMAKGARTAPLQWLLGRLDLPVLASPAAGNRRPPIGTRGSGQGTEDDDDRPRWKPGRGATTKTGPARRVARHKRHPRAT
jgi:hypothetical protein